ncbi:MAG: hypothetical protein QNJ16_00715 [Rhodobacter sp.]|nr:hypothetical protein [Rhodobacter sp.]
MRLIATLLCCLAVPAASQDRNGNDTAGAWRAVHQASFGLWDSLCDTRDAETRCYLRYVDVYRPRPQFGALFAFVERLNGAERVTFGLEFGRAFGPGRIEIKASGGTQWALAPDICQGAAECILAGRDADAILDAMATGETVAIAFTDQYGDEQARIWDLSQFAAALADLRVAAAERGI